jgi:hypothetical protein
MKLIKWTEQVQNHLKWKDIVKKANTLIRAVQEEEKKEEEEEEEEDCQDKHGPLVQMVALLPACTVNFTDTNSIC